MNLLKKTIFEVRGGFLSRYSVNIISAIIIFTIGTVNLLVLSYFTYDKLKIYTESRYREKSEIILSQAADSIDARMKHTENLISHIVERENLAERKLSAYAIKKILDKYTALMPGIKRLIYAEKESRAVMSPGIKFTENYRPRVREWHRKATEKKGIVWTEPFLDYFDQQIVFSVSMPVINKQGQTEGVIAAIFEVENYNSFVSSEDLGEKSFMFLLSGSGTVIANRNNYFIGKTLFKGKIPFSGPGDKVRTFSCDINRMPYEVSATVLGSNYMFMAAAVSLTEIQETLKNDFYDILFILAGVLLFFSMITYLLTRKGIAPLSRLSDLMSEAEKGNYSVRADFSYYSEVNKLSGQFNRMLDGIRSRDEILRHREIKIKNLAYYDSLTGLPNRAYLLKKLEEVLDSTDAPEKDYSGINGAIFYIDLDGFKVINDSMGHSTGDRVLEEVAARLKHNLRHGQIAARLGGDEFVILLQNIDSTDVLLNMANRFLDIINRPIVIDASRYEVGASIGIVLYPVHGVKADTLLKKADMAMYKAKRNGKNNFQIFEENLEDEIIRKNILERGIRHSINEKQFTVYYQPLYSFKTGGIYAIEALLRNNSPELEGFELGEIISTAEETGMIRDIERIVFNESFSFIKKINRKRRRKIRLSVNISSSHIMQNEFIENFMAMTDKHEIDINLLDIEVTETVMINSEGAVKLQKLREKGMGIHMDDFGTGYSSLSYLQKLPLDCIKIDRSFIESMENDLKKKNIISLIIEMAHNLGLKVVAEGIETEQQYYFLKAFGCDFAQGYYLSRPVKGEDVLLLL